MSRVAEVRWPAEWEKHDATWIAWPHEPSDWPGKFETVRWVYAEIVRILGVGERIEIIAHDQEVKEQALSVLAAHDVPTSSFRLHLNQNDRSWLRDSAPTAVIVNGQLTWQQWAFNGWAKYDNYTRDQTVPQYFAQASGYPLNKPQFKNRPFVIEGGAIDGDGQGTILVTEECLLSDVQCRNPGLSKQDYEEVFKRELGCTKVLWLPGGIVGDDTHGHIDDVARFVAPGRVVQCVEEDPTDSNFEILQENFKFLAQAKDAAGRSIEVVKLPLPAAVTFEGERLPASYANFYIGNSVVIVPTFNDSNDRKALEIIQNCFPSRTVVGIACRDLVLGLGTLHCLTQQQPTLN